MASHRSPALDLGQSQSHNLQAIGPLDSDFNAAVDSAYPGLRDLNAFESVKRQVILVTNESSHQIHAFVMKWTVQASGEAPNVIYSPFMRTPTPSHVLTGGGILAPGESRLLSPWFSLTKAQFASMQGGNGSQDALSAFLRAQTAGPAKDTKLLSASVDGVVFGDAHFVGPDESKLFDHFECERNGQHDEGSSISRFLSNNASDQEIIDTLNAHIQKGQLSRGGNDRESLYYTARGTEAQMLLQIFKQAGRSDLQRTVDQLLKFGRTSLQR
jgi:hypothetical protein